MKAPHLLTSGAVALALVSGACNRADKTVDRQEVQQGTREAAGKAKEAAGKAGEKIADGWLMTKIQAQYFADHDIRSRDISVSARDGVVVLRGRVQDENAHTQALQTARNTDGVREVVDQLAVGLETPTASAPAAPGQGGVVATTGEAAADVAARAAALLDDARVTSTIQSKYFLDETVKGRHIDVDASHGVVTVHGEVASDAERAQALRLARSTDGVQRVEDALSVNAALASPAPAAPAAGDSPTVGQRVDDATITTKIQAKYFLDRDVKAGGMDVTTKDGVVMLEGTVATQAAKDRALELARETEGVVQVVDRLQVRAATPAPKRPAATTKSRAH